MTQEFFSFVFAARNPVCVARVCVGGSCNSDKDVPEIFFSVETTHERHQININFFLFL